MIPDLPVALEPYARDHAIPGQCFLVNHMRANGSVEINSRKEETNADSPASHVQNVESNTAPCMEE